MLNPWLFIVGFTLSLYLPIVVVLGVDAVMAWVKRRRYSRHRVTWWLNG